MSSEDAARHDPTRLPLAVLFDIDGTLIDTGGAGARSWAYAFSTLQGVPADILKFSEVGMTDPDVAHQTFVGVIGREPQPRETAQLIAGYLERLPYEVEHSPGYRVLPGVADLMPRLARQGVLLGITTGAVEAAAHIKLGPAGLNRFFAFGGYGSDSPDRTELTRRAIQRGGVVRGHPLDPRKVLVVGDTPKDIDAGHGAGAVAVGVASGHYSVQELREAGADHVLASLADPLPNV